MKIKDDFIKSNTDGIIPNVTAIVLASDQSTLELKHPLFSLAGKPLIYYTLDELRKTKNISNIIVSSEFKEILDYADKMIKNISHNRVLIKA